MISRIYFIDAPFSPGIDPFIWMPAISNDYDLICIKGNYSEKLQNIVRAYAREDKVALVINNPVDIDIARNYDLLSWNHIYGFDWRKQKFISFKEVSSCMKLTPQTKIWDRFYKFGDYNNFLR